MRLHCLLPAVLILVSAAPTSRPALHEQAERESLTSIRPGRPGVAPFWNEQAKQFAWAPAFDFTPVVGAASYRFTVTSLDGGGASRAFEAKDPFAPLSPVWRDVPPRSTRVRAEALDARGQVIGVAGERSFHRAAVFNGPYGAPAKPYDESARAALAGLVREPFMQYWRTHGEPDPSYRLYRYASKLIAGVMSGCAMHASQSPRPADADEALEIGRRAADWLIAQSKPAGEKLEFFPPTYRNISPQEKEDEKLTMLMSPAEAGQGYLNLYDATHDGRYLDAAKRIAATYTRLQLPSGTWWLKVDNRSGEPIVENLLIPSVVISFLDRLVTQYHCEECKSALERAVAWVMTNPVKTFDWGAQFDDAKIRKPYQNLSKHEACEFASYLLEHANGDESKIATAREILRFAEDQFVVWEHPPDLPPRRGMEQLAPSHWFLPCSLEQYAMFEPISGSSAFMIMSYLRAYEVTREPLYLAKAQSLGNALTAAQVVHGGSRYPTRMIEQDLAYWLNSTVNTARAMDMLSRAR